MPWKPRRLQPLEQDNAALRSELIKLRHDLQTKQTALGGLQLALHQRSEHIDQLNSTIDRLRAANQKARRRSGAILPDAGRQLTNTARIGQRRISRASV
jgi:hypothetical protein